MKHFIFTLLTLVGCYQTEPNERTDSTLNPPEPITIFLTDSGSIPFVKLTTTINYSTYLIEWGNETFSNKAELNDLVENRGYRLPPTLRWWNKDYICLMTNHTGPFSEHLFLPLNNTLKVRYYKETIEWMDTISNKICFVDIYNRDSLRQTWVYENLISGYRYDFEIPIYDHSCCFPFISDIKADGHTLIIEPQGDYEKKIQIETK